MIARQPPIYVSGKTVLRYGFLEGDAVVDADRAVYDPQTSNAPTAFAENGSRANTVALVLNESEIRSLTGLDDLNECAERLIYDKAADVVVVKAGTRGALVFDQNCARYIVPAFRSERVFKIGTGDVFSAMFSLHWGHEHRNPAEAAELASRAVAAYCSDRQLPVAPSALRKLQSVPLGQAGQVLLEGSVTTLGHRYTMEEARFQLRDLGAVVCAPQLDGNSAGEITATLVLGDAVDEEAEARLRRLDPAVPMVVLLEDGDSGTIDWAPPNTQFTSDFASALYFAVWASIRPTDSQTARVS